MAKGLDSIDRRILAELQDNGRMPIVELAERVNLTKTPCAERVRRLERDGIIKAYRAELDADAMGAGFVIIVHVTLNKTSDDALEKFNAAVMRVPEVQKCYLLAGQFDYMLEIRTSDISHYRNVLGDEIGKLPGVQQTNSFVVMEEVKNKKTLRVRTAR
jgi:Lrp/AsnC family leucine-responsive transcriptional regulator